MNISNLHDSYNFLSLTGEKMSSIHFRGFIEKQNTSFYLLEHQARIWRSTINSKHGAHLVWKPQSIYCCIWNIFSNCHIIYYHTFLTRHFLGTKIDRYICQFNFLQTKEKIMAQISVLSLEQCNYHLRSLLVKDARSSAFSSKKWNYWLHRKKKIYACMYASSLFSHSNRTIYGIYLKEMYQSC